MISVWLASFLGVPGGAIARDWEVVAQQGLMKFIYVDKAKERDDPTYESAINELCDPTRHCYLHFWTERQMVPRNLPMTSDQLETRSATYTWNPRSRFRQFLWNCRIEKRPESCFR